MTCRFLHRQTPPRIRPGRARNILRRPRGNHLASQRPALWTQIDNILRDPFEITVGADTKTLLGYGGALAAPSTAYLYNWNILPIGQLLWLKELESYAAFPPMQDPASYNLSSVLEAVKKQGHQNPSQ